jgi:hypothetical protein
MFRPAIPQSAAGPAVAALVKPQPFEDGTQGVKLNVRLDILRNGWFAGTRFSGEI